MICRPQAQEGCLLLVAWHTAGQCLLSAAILSALEAPGLRGLGMETFAHCGTRCGSELTSWLLCPALPQRSQGLRAPVEQAHTIISCTTDRKAGAQSQTHSKVHQASTKQDGSSLPVQASTAPTCRACDSAPSLSSKSSGPQTFASALQRWRALAPLLPAVRAYSKLC